MKTCKLCQERSIDPKVVAYLHDSTGTSKLCMPCAKEVLAFARRKWSERN